MTDAPAAPIAANVEKVAPMMTTPNATETKRVTIRDVAALAGVDASLVSRVLNDHPKASAGPATRQRIVEAASKLGYHPNVAARSLRTAKTWTLGLLLPNLTNPMYAAIARAAERRAQERGYGLVFGTHVEGEDEATFARMMQQRRVEGLRPFCASTKSTSPQTRLLWPAIRYRSCAVRRKQARESMSFATGSRTALLFSPATAGWARVRC